MALEVTVELEALTNGADEPNQPQHWEQMKAGTHHLTIYGTSLNENAKGSTVAWIKVRSKSERASFETWFLQLSDASDAPKLDNLRALMSLYDATGVAIPARQDGILVIDEVALLSLKDQEFSASVSFNDDGFLRLNDITTVVDNAPEMDGKPLPDKFL